MRRAPGVATVVAALCIAALILVVTPGAAPAAPRHVPSYCAPTATVTACKAAHKQEVAQDKARWPSSGTELTKHQIIQRNMDMGVPTNPPTHVYVHKTTLAKANKHLVMPGVSPATPVYIVTIHFADGSVATDVDDAVNGVSFVGCSGCDTVQPDGATIGTIG